RRRHTRFSRDWSSDVCSSDLEKVQEKANATQQRMQKPSRKTEPREQDPAVEAIWRLQKRFPLAFPVSPAPKVPLKEGILQDAERSEERRVGKGGGYRWARYRG